MKKRKFADAIADAIGGTGGVARARKRRFATQGAQRVTNRGNSRKGRLTGHSGAPDIFKKRKRR